MSYKQNHPYLMQIVYIIKNRLQRQKRAKRGKDTVSEIEILNAGGKNQ